MTAIVDTFYGRLILFKMFVDISPNRLFETFVVENLTLRKIVDSHDVNSAGYGTVAGRSKWTH